MTEELFVAQTRYLLMFSYGSSSKKTTLKVKDAHYGETKNKID